ncbi:MAG: hypothetical protein HOP28_07440 [Gemmatimonadales bacterium]|nr:hypothetical protein [Gemmatimonadales bacterium]
MRLMLGPSRSGSTAFARMMSRHPAVQIVRNNLKAEFLREGKPVEYTLYDHLRAVRKPFAFAKLTFGMSTAAVCAYNPFPSDAILDSVHPLFLFRDPIDTLNSWKVLGRDTRLFRIAYRHAIDLFMTRRAVSRNVRCIVYEQLTRDPRVLHSVLAAWGLSALPTMTDWRDEHQEDRRQEVLKLIQRSDYLTSHHRTLLESEDFHYCKPPVLLPKMERMIAESFVDEYEYLAGLSAASFAV